jgi:hypothetical protein
MLENLLERGECHAVQDAKPERNRQAFEVSGY